MPAVVLGGAATASAAPQRNPAASLTPAAAPGSVTADQQPACGGPGATEFPIGTRIHGGPDTYASGGGYGTWFLDLTNRTSESCRSIHPVLVLTDEDRVLTADQIQLEFSERSHPGVEHRVSWETTDRDEHIGVFGGDGDDSFGGFTVPAGRTVTVQVRLAFTSDTSPGRITANAAIVQRQHPGGGKGDSDAVRKGGDGQWVGESEDYPFTVIEDRGEDNGDEDGTDSGVTDEPGEPWVTGDVGGTGKEGKEMPGREQDGGRLTGQVPGRPDFRPTRPGGAARPVAPGRDPAGVPQLASTGISVPVKLPALAFTTFLIGGGAVVVATRRMRRAPH